MLLGLTGKRGVGKTTLARLLVLHCGFQSLHSFGPGLTMCEAYYIHLLRPYADAVGMAYSLTYDPDYKDRPFSEIKMNIGRGAVTTLDQLLPGHNSRQFMERLGKFMGTDLGSDYTLLAELAVQRRLNPSMPLVAESIVYEADTFRERGGIIVRVSRSTRDTSRVGEKSDEYVDSIVPDYDYHNEEDGPEETLYALNRWLDNFHNGRLAPVIAR